ncbi:HAD family hydrolase [Coleofasciculus sp. H7-2]|uniref:HAD family hydrolase n=1 Tax=Coleofasciculus sp. H7-2 TaxID=3351545 RepID=UPI00366AB6E4
MFTVEKNYVGSWWFSHFTEFLTIFVSILRSCTILLQFSGDRTIICGDSGNDLSMFQNVPSCGIIVGNAQPELLEWHHNSPPGKRYLAKSHFAAGILEGLDYFGFLSRSQEVTNAASSAVWENQ